ncbi:MAG: isochorismatase family cysteine hydrolase, partial [Pseudomonadota bacterium]
PEVVPQGDELVVDKTSAGTFNSTPLDQILRNMGVDRLLVCGIVTEGCVELTARDAADRGYYVTLVEDACASSTRVAHDDALQRMSDGGLIRVRKTAEIEHLIQSAAATSEPETVPG